MVNQFFLRSVVLGISLFIFNSDFGNLVLVFSNFLIVVSPQGSEFCRNKRLVTFSDVLILNSSLFKVCTK